MFRFPLALCAALISAAGQPVFGGDIIDSSSVIETSTDSSINGSQWHSTSKKTDDPTRGIPIDSGLVVLNGQVMESPYVVSRSNGNVFINDKLVVGAKDIADMKSRSDREFAAQLEHELLSVGWVLAFDGGVVALTDAEAGMMLVRALAQAESQPEQIKLAMESTMTGTSDITTAEWRVALKNFQPDELILKWAGRFEEEMSLMEDDPTGEPVSYFQAHDSTRTMYGLSVVGMLLIALSAGTLLGHPPKNSISWSRIVRSPRTATAMKRCLVLIAAYSLFDLVATMLALKTGHVEELNPLGVGLVLAPAALAMFKVSATCLGAGLLWRLKNYHGAQVASWWLCMVLTLVTVRWVTVQSLFFV